MSDENLTPSEKFEIACFCVKGANFGWSVDKVTGVPVHSVCGKPSPERVIRKCSECRNEFHMAIGPRWRSKYFIVEENGITRVFERTFLCPRCY